MYTKINHEFKMVLHTFSSRTVQLGVVVVSLRVEVRKASVKERKERLKVGEICVRGRIQNKGVGCTQ